MQSHIISLNVLVGVMFQYGALPTTGNYPDPDPERLHKHKHNTCYYKQLPSSLRQLQAQANCH